MKKEETLAPRTHVGIHVSDIEKTVEFYTKFFGIAPTKIKANYAKYELKSPSLVISFVVDKDKVKSNFGHLGIQVYSEDELKRKFETIKSVGLNYVEENKVSCCYALQDKFWVTDPDGIKWEVYQFHEDVDINDPHETTQCCNSLESKEKENCCEKESLCC